MQHNFLRGNAQKIAGDPQRQKRIISVLIAHQLRNPSQNAVRIEFYTQRTQTP
jgi:hypothetical protein